MMVYFTCPLSFTDMFIKVPFVLKYKSKINLHNSIYFLTYHKYETYVLFSFAYINQHVVSA